LDTMELQIDNCQLKIKTGCSGKNIRNPVTRDNPVKKDNPRVKTSPNRVKTAIFAPLTLGTLNFRHLT